MPRTKLRDRVLPGYTRLEEWFNSISHIVGGAFGIIVLVMCLLISCYKGDGWGIAGSIVYGISTIVLYTISSIYHALKPEMAKKVMQIIDHCAVYLLIAGTYTPILLVGLRKENAVLAWVLFGFEWGMAALCVALNAVDLKKYRVFSMIIYIIMGWCIIVAIKPIIRVMSVPGFLLLLAGGISFTIGAVLYGLGKRKRYMHSVFHLFVLMGSILQFVSIAVYIL
ncbi:MAG TPA: hemolysin III family protein [Firmicutes bacterium]|nr:hemolysin III family protein [Bacillota bacterium]